MSIELIHEQAYKVIAQQIEDAGLRLEDNFRASDQGFLVSDRAAAIMKAQGCPHEIPSVKSLEGLGIKRSPFRHPLSDGDEKRGLNFWFASSILISSALGWIPGEPPQPVAVQNLKMFVGKASPLVDAIALMNAARYDDRSLMKLASLTAQGMEKLLQSKTSD